MASVEETIRSIRYQIGAYFDQITASYSEIQSLETEIEKLEAFKRIVENSKGNYEGTLYLKKIKLQATNSLSATIRSAGIYRSGMNSELSGTQTQNVISSYNMLLERITERINSLNSIIGKKREGIRGREIIIRSL